MLDQANRFSDYYYSNQEPPAPPPSYEQHPDGFWINDKIHASEFTPSLPGYPPLGKFTIGMLTRYLREGGELSLDSAEIYLPPGVLSDPEFAREITSDKAVRHPGCALLRLRSQSSSDLGLPAPSPWNLADFGPPKPTLPGYLQFNQFDMKVLVEYLQQGGNLTEIDAYQQLPLQLLEHPYFTDGLIDSRDARAASCGNLYLTAGLLSNLTALDPGAPEKSGLPWTPRQILVAAVAVWGAATITTAFFYAAYRKLQRMYAAPPSGARSRLVENDELQIQIELDDLR